MRVCDKCQTPKPLIRTWLDKKDMTEYDFCEDCYQILRVWLYNDDRKKEHDPVEEKKPTRRK